MVFCNLLDIPAPFKPVKGHNPYFNRWFSAIYLMPVCNCSHSERHNPYFNRWFSAIINDWKKWDE